MRDLPEYYFRTRENGATVFRVGTQARDQRIELTQIAVVNIRNGEIRPHGGSELSEADQAAIRGWMSERRATLDRRETDDIQRTVDRLKLVAHWAQSRATPDELDEVGEALLLAMHDLRSVLLRKRADRLRKD
ncbi:hypothetical protein R5H30_16860 [Sulfitobacter sp. D35]|uniref:hypothetical protein n=1 Tax=Sulfitobacter sp. D35 TaxID=3083252 RepID=UPI00296FD659|nr:hypothetical protein [Sulfitobacter sp. D35]MDW4499667.1 hypothetical protein [Sulfitobacter sp. D35]